MPDTSQNPANGVASFFTEIIEQQELSSRARVLAGFASELIPDSAVSVYTLASVGDERHWVPRAIIGEATIHEQAIASDSGLLGDLFESDGDPITISAPQLGKLVNRMRSSHDCEPWTFGVGALMKNLAQRKLL